MERVGDISQIAGIRASKLAGGKAEGVRCLDVKTGSGLSFAVVPDRCLDLAWTDYRGFALGYMSCVGMVGSGYFQLDGEAGFLKNFFAGLMTTCGLSNIGVPCFDDGEPLGLHGVIGNTPAEDVSVSQSWQADDFVMRISGTVRQSRFKGEHLVLRRTISTELGSSQIRLNDTVTNEGFTSRPFALLYHINFGYPIVSESTRLYTPETTITPRTDEAKGGLESYDRFQGPTEGYREQVFYHELEAAADGTAYACLFNPMLAGDGLGAVVRYNVNQLPILTEWKEMGQGAYAVGLEPCTAHLEGRDRLREEGKLEQLEPGEERSFDLEISVVDGADALQQLRNGG